MEAVVHVNSTPRPSLEGEEVLDDLVTRLVLKARLAMSVLAHDVRFVSPAGDVSMRIFANIPAFLSDIVL